MDKAKREEKQREYLAAARLLAQRYLEETGLSAEAARKGLVYTWGEWANYRRFKHLPEEEEQYRTALIVTPGAPPVPDLLTWVQPHIAELESHEVDLGDGFYRTEAPDRYELAVALELLAGEEAQQRVEGAEQRAADAERRLAERPGRRLHKTQELSDRTLLPRPLVEGWSGPEHFGQKLARVAQQEMFANPESLAVLRQAEAQVEGRQLAGLSTLEVRALIAVYRIFSGQENGKEFLSRGLQVPAKLLYQAAGIDARQPNLCRDLAAALDAIGSRDLYFALVFNDPDHPEKKWVVGERTPAIVVRPMWTDRTPAEAEQLAHEWAGKARNENKQWSGALPDEYMLKLPLVMSKVWDALVIGGDLLDRLEKGAKAIRGKSQGFQSIDWALFMEVTSRTQAQQLSDDRKTLLSYVDRRKFLESHYGVEEVEAAIKRGKYKTRMIPQFEKAAKVLLAGGLVGEWRPKKEARRGGERDVFAPDPGIVKGLAARAASEAERQDKRQIALPLPKSKRRKAARK